MQAVEHMLIDRITGLDGHPGARHVRDPSSRPGFHATGR